MKKVIFLILTILVVMFASPAWAQHGPNSPQCDKAKKALRLNSVTQAEVDRICGDSKTAMRWCAKEKRDIPAKEWTRKRCHIAVTPKPPPPPKEEPFDWGKWLPYFLLFLLALWHIRHEIENKRRKDELTLLSGDTEALKPKDP